MSISSLRRHLLALALIFAVTFAICLPGIAKFGGVSLYDEITHFDYAEKISRGELVSPVEPLGDAALDEWACRPGTWQPENFCDLTLADQTDNEQFPAEGLNYNGFHPPLYYVLTGLGARAITAVASVATDLSLFVSMRLMSAFWLAAGLSALYLVLTRWVRRSIATATTLIVGTTPAVASFGMMINPDAMAILASAAALYLAWRLSIGKASIWWGVGIAFLVASTKLLAVSMVLIVVTVWVALTWLSLTKGEEKQVTLTFIGTLVGTAASALVAKLLTGANLGLANPISGLSTDPVVSSPAFPLMTALGQNYSLTTPYWMVDGADSTAWGLSARLLGIAVVAGSFVALWHFKSAEPPFRIALAAILGALSIPLLIQIREVLTHGEYFANLASRYSLTVIPFACAAFAFLAKEKKNGGTVLTIASVFTTLIALSSVLI